MTKGLEGLDTAVHQTHVWINDLDARLGWENKPRAFRLLKAALHELRDHLPVNESAHLAAQLPTLLRGVFYDQWKPATNPVKDRAAQTMLDRIQHAFRTDPLSDPEMAVGAVFALLAEKVTPGEIAQVRQSLPPQIRALWPDAKAAQAG